MSTADCHIDGLSINTPGIHFKNGISYVCSQKELSLKLILEIANAKDDAHKLESVLRKWFKDKK